MYLVTTFDDFRTNFECPGELLFELPTADGKTIVIRHYVKNYYLLEYTVENNNNNKEIHCRGHDDIYNLMNFVFKQNELNSYELEAVWYSDMVRNGDERKSIHKYYFYCRKHKFFECKNGINYSKARKNHRLDGPSVILEYIPYGNLFMNYRCIDNMHLTEKWYINGITYPSFDKLIELPISPELALILSSLVPAFTKLKRLQMLRRFQTFLKSKQGSEFIWSPENIGGVRTKQELLEFFSK
jgi:hypothetical protein